MPSNALKISQLVEMLNELMSLHGDIDCVMPVFYDSAVIALDTRNLNVSGELLGRSLPTPVLVFGMVRDEQGRVRNMPGTAYEATADDGYWSYRRDDALEDTDLVVWKRHGGQDIGKRVGDRWFVREGAAEWPARPIEIIPAGIMAWRLP